MKQLFLTSIFLAFFISLLGAATVDVRITSSSDDAVEEINSGGVYINEPQLDIVVYDLSYIAPQKVGLRFTNIQIPQNAKINNAYIQFRARQDDIGETNIRIVGENSTTPLTYALTSSNITNRTETSAYVDWLNVSAWTGGQDYQTVDITSIVQELVDLGTWQIGNAMAIMMKPYDANCKDGECSRMAVSFEGDTALAPLLHIVYDEAPTPPQMGNVPDSQAHIDIPFILNTSDYVTPTDGDPILGYSLTGTLPPGLEFDNVTGIISGVPELIESQTLTVTATDKDGESTPDSFIITVVENQLVVEYRMDECYWLGSAYKSVMDSSSNGLNGTSYNDAVIDNVNFQINASGSFDGTGDYVDIDDDPKLQFTDKMTVSFWVRPTRDNTDEYYVAKRSNNAGWYIQFNNKFFGTDAIEFYAYISGNWELLSINKPASWTNNWHFITVSYDGNHMKMFIDDLSATTARTGLITNSSNTMTIGQYNNGNYFNGNIDEVKVWNTALSNTEISAIYANELLKKNYNGAERDEVICEATVDPISWELVGIPIDIRNDPKTVTETFQGITGVYGTDWRVYRRDYSDTNNSSWYTYLDDPDNNMIEFGKGYWLGNASSTEETWNVDGTQAVEYDSTHIDCPANQCVEIDVKSVSLNANTVPTPDDLLGTGPYRYNLAGFVGKSPVSWADCRFIIDGTSYTPTEAENAGYASKKIWQYNSNGGNEYSTCDDTGASGTCLLVPYKGFWVELRGPTKNLPVKLLIPKE